MEEAIILPLRDAFYKEHGIPLPVKNNKSLGENTDSVSSCDDANGNVCNNNDGSNNCDDARTKADEKHEEKVVSASETEQKEVSADNANTVLASVSENSTGGAAQNGSSNRQGKGTFRKEKLNGSEKRKKKAFKKNNNNDPEKAKKQDTEAVKQPLSGYVEEEEKKTLAEYERMCEEKKKSSEASKTELRKVSAEDFKDCQMLEKKLDDEEAVMKVEKAQPKVKEASKKEEIAEAEGNEAAVKDGKPKKVIIPLVDLSFRQPSRRVYAQEDGSSSRGRFNGGFQGGSHDNSTEPRVSRHDNNGRAAPKEASFHNGNGMPRGAYNGRGNRAPRGDYSSRRDEYRGNDGYGYSRGNGDYQDNGVYHQQPQGGNVGRFQQGRAGNDGGYYPQQQGGQNRRCYQQRGNSGDRRNSAPAPDLAVEDMTLFPALPAPASARAAAPDSAPATAPAPSPASAPTTAPALSPAA